MKTTALFLCLFAAAFGQSAWVNQSPIVSDDVWGVTSADKTFAAVTGRGNLLTSADGRSWRSEPLAPGVWLTSITNGAGLWVAVGEAGVVYRSADLKTWALAKVATSNRLNAVVYTGKIFVVVGESGTVATSPDAQAWTLRASGTESNLRGLVTLNLNTIAACGSAGTILQSKDGGTTWAKPISEPTKENLETLTAHAGIVVAAGSGGYCATFSLETDKMTGVTGVLTMFSLRSFRSLGGKGILRASTWGAGSFVLAGESGVIFTSRDGANWSQRFAGESPSTLSSAAALAISHDEIGGRFLIVGALGSVLAADDDRGSVVNVSTRGRTSPSDPLIGGFVVSGVAPRNVLIRAAGPTLAAFGVPSALPDPILSVYDSSGILVARNVRWGTNDNLSALVEATLRGAFPFASGSADSALYLTLSPGAYTAIVTSTGSSSGTVLFEAYAP